MECKRECKADQIKALKVDTKTTRSVNSDITHSIGIIKVVSTKGENNIRPMISVAVSSNCGTLPSGGTPTTKAIIKAMIRAIVIVKV